MLEVEESKDSVLLTWSEPLLDFFKSRKLFLRYPWQIDDVYRPGSRIRVHKAAVAEPYSNHPSGRIVTMGAFSYCRTANIAHDFRAGRYCSIARDVQLSEQEHPLDRISTHPFTTHQHMVKLADEEFGRQIHTSRHVMTGPAPLIGNDVWIGSGALIKRGISVGHGAVIGARALVTKDVPPYAVVGGAPARILKYRFDENRRRALLDVQWWRYNYTDLPQVDPTEIDRFVDDLNVLIEQNLIAPFEPTPIKVVDELRNVFGF